MDEPQVNEPMLKSIYDNAEVNRFGGKYLG